MSINANMGGVNGAFGFINGITKTINTPNYINSVIEYSHARMAEALDEYIDMVAMASGSSLHHVYEWPKKFRNYSETVGVPQYRLWRHTLTGRGRNRTAGFRFLASKRAVPVNPDLITDDPQKSVKEGVHIWYWKAPAMEAGIDIVVEPKISRKLAYINTNGNGLLTFRAGPVNTGEAGGGKTTGRFTTIFTSWWGSMASEFFDRELASRFEQDLNPQGRLEKLVSKLGRSKAKTFSLGSTEYSTAMNAAERMLRENQKDYISGAMARRRLIYGDV